MALGSTQKLTEQRNNQINELLLIVRNNEERDLEQKLERIK